MRSLHVCGQAVATALIAFGVGLAVVPTASADPIDPNQPLPPAPAPAPGAPPAPDAAPASADPSSPTTDACTQFNLALNYAAINYEDFADFSAGSGNYVNYTDPTVQNANVAGRTALRQAAATALAASTVPGVPPDISAPMQAWSLNAAKLVVIMGVHGGGDSLNSTAVTLNNDAHNAQMACVAAGVQAQA